MDILSKMQNIMFGKNYSHNKLYMTVNKTATGKVLL